MRKTIIATLILTSTLSFANSKLEKAQEMKLQKECKQEAMDLGCVRADGTVVRSCERVIELSDECKKALGL